MEREISRRSFLKNSAIVLSAGAVSGLSGAGNVFAEGPDKSKVFFTRDISANGLLTIYSRINQDITGKTGIKLHTGEPNGPNILPRDMVKALQQHIPIATWWKQIPCIRARDILRQIIAKPLRSTVGISARRTSWTRMGW